MRFSVYMSAGAEDFQCFAQTVGAFFYGARHLAQCLTGFVERVAKRTQGFERFFFTAQGPHRPFTSRAHLVLELEDYLCGRFLADARDLGEVAVVPASDRIAERLDL